MTISEAKEKLSAKIDEVGIERAREIQAERRSDELNDYSSRELVEELYEIHLDGFKGTPINQMTKEQIIDDIIVLYDNDELVDDEDFEQELLLYTKKEVV